MDYVIIARKPAATMNFEEVKKSLEHVLKISKFLKRTTRVKQNKHDKIEKMN